MTRPVSVPRFAAFSPRRALALSALFLAALSFSSPPAAEGGSLFGSWVPAPDVIVPGIPKAELTIGGTPYLLLESPDPAAPIGALLWNPAGSISLAPGPGVVIDFVSGVAGMQTASGPLVFAYGNFEIAGTETRVILWDGANWGFAQGPVAGVVPNQVRVRSTPSGPELWVAGDVILIPGSTTLTPIARFDGSQWSIPGSVVGQISELEAIDEGLPSGDAIYIGGNLITAGGTFTQNVARYDGAWSNLAGGLAGLDPLLSVIELAPGQPEIWVTVGTSLNTEELHVWSQGAWVERTPPLPNGLFLFTDLGRMALLPTHYGDWVIGDAVAFTAEGAAALGWDPTTETWRPVTTSSAFAFSFDSPSGLFPAGVYDASTPLSPRRWEVAGEQFIRGDANNDAQVDIADAIFILANLFPIPSNPVEPIHCREAANANRDEALNIADAIFILGALFPNSTGPNMFQAPFPDCGIDASFSSLGCDEGPSICP